MTKYFKVTNDKEIHNGYVYKDGLNILDKPFQEIGSCVEGGLYFTTAKHIHKFYSYGIYLREITLPETDPDFKMVKDGNKWRANKIILGAKHSLLDPETYIKFGLRIDLDYILSKSPITINLNQLNLWKEAGLDPIIINLKNA